MNVPSHSAPVYPPVRPGPRSGIVFLRDQVALFCSVRQLPIVVTPVGARYRGFVGNQAPGVGGNRIVFIPGEFVPGSPTARKYGTLSRDTLNSESVCNPRELLAWSRAITVSLWSAPPPGKMTDEEAAFDVADDMLEVLARAVTQATYPDGSSVAASIEWGDVQIVSPPVENSFGVEVLVSIKQLAPFFGETLDVVQATPNLMRTNS